jgi:hypothetical protein
MIDGADRTAASVALPLDDFDLLFVLENISPSLDKFHGVF